MYRPARSPTTCYLAQFSPCGGDAPNPYLCNTHAKLFGLTYKRTQQINGSNQSETSIRAYSISNTNLKIPLFINKDGAISFKEMTTFFSNRMTRDTSKVNPLLQAICSSSALNCTPMETTWVDSAKFIYMGADDVPKYLPGAELPALTKIILRHMIPSMVNPQNGTRHHRLEHLVLRTGVDDYEYAFVQENPMHLLKMLDVDNVNADVTLLTPLVVAALYESTNGEPTHIVDYNGICNTIL